MRPSPPVGHGKTVGGLLLFLGAMATLPFLIHKRNLRLTQGETLINSDKPLPNHAVRRGAYMNSGSKDVGVDPDWDLKAGTYKGQKFVQDASK